MFDVGCFRGVFSKKILDLVGKKKIKFYLFDVNKNVKKYISNLLKFVKTKDAVKIEKELCKIVDKQDWTIFAHLLIDHGRAVCIANRPKCQSCIIADFCPSKKGGS